MLGKMLLTDGINPAKCAVSNDYNDCNTVLTQYLLFPIVVNSHTFASNSLFYSIF